MPTVADAMTDFLAQRRIAVAGVSRQKGGAHSGNGIYRRLKERGYEVFAVKPNTDTIEDGEPCYRSLDANPGWLPHMRWVIGLTKSKPTAG